jgi:hypothetical protein
MLVSVQDGLLWARFRGVRVEDAIRAIAESAQFEVEVHRQLPSTVDISFDGRPIVDAVHWLLGKNSWVASYDPSGRVSQLHVYGRPSEEMGNDTRPSPRIVSSTVATPEKQSEPAAHQDRLETIKELVRNRPKGAFDELASALVEDADPAVRWNAAAALANFPGDPAADALIAVLADPAEESNVRRVAAWALGRLGVGDGERILRHAAASDPDPLVRQAAEEALRATTRPLAAQRRQRTVGRTVEQRRGAM